MRTTESVAGGTTPDQEESGATVARRAGTRGWWDRVRGRLHGGVRDGRDGDAGRGAEAGMATAEYAIATVAAAGFAGLLILVLRSDEVREMLTSIVRGALSI